MEAATTPPGQEVVTGYDLFSQNEGDKPGESRPRGTFPSLADAMAAAGHPGPADWYSATGIPGKIYVRWELYYDDEREYQDDEYLYLPWSIRAPGVASELAGITP